MPKQNRSRRSLESVLEATAKLLTTSSEDFTISDVARNSSVSKATIYRYFPSLESIFVVLAAPYADRAKARLEAAIAEVDDTADAVLMVKELFDELVVFVDEDDLARALFITSFNRRYIGEFVNDTIWELAELGANLLAPLLGGRRSRQVRRAAIGIQSARSTLDLSIELEPRDREKLFDDFRTMMFLAADVSLDGPDLAVPDVVPEPTAEP